MAHGSQKDWKIYPCSSCFRSFATNQVRRDHENKEHGPSKSICPHCQGKFDNPNDLQGHLFRAHSISNGERFPIGSFPCSQCNREFPYNNMRVLHEEIHGVNFPCVFCPAGFLSREGLQTHYADFHQSEKEYRNAMKKLVKSAFNFNQKCEDKVEIIPQKNPLKSASKIPEKVPKSHQFTNKIQEDEDDEVEIISQTIPVKTVKKLTKKNDKNAPLLSKIQKFYQFPNKTSKEKTLEKVPPSLPTENDKNAPFFVSVLSKPPEDFPNSHQFPNKITEEKRVEKSDKSATFSAPVLSKIPEKVTKSHQFPTKTSEEKTLEKIPTKSVQNAPFVVSVLTRPSEITTKSHQFLSKITEEKTLEKSDKNVPFFVSVLSKTPEEIPQKSHQFPIKKPEKPTDLKSLELSSSATKISSSEIWFPPINANSYKTIEKQSRPKFQSEAFKAKKTVNVATLIAQNLAKLAPLPIQTEQNQQFYLNVVFTPNYIQPDDNCSTIEIKKPRLDFDNGFEEPCVSSDNCSNIESTNTESDFVSGFEDPCSILRDVFEEEVENYENTTDPLGTFETDINFEEIKGESDFKTETEELGEESGDPVLWVMEGVSDT